MAWKFNKDKPIYNQIVEYIKIRVVNGKYKPGDRIPSVRDFAVEAGVNPNTMQRALSELERENILVTERTSGRFVTSNKKDLMTIKENLSNSYIEELFDSLLKLNMTNEDIVALVVKKARRKE